MARRCLVIPFPNDRVRRRGQRGTAALDAQRELDALEQAQLKLCFWCFAMSAALTTALALML
ncbi:MAG TPA: hypothetical protein VM686_30205 [Polyangiaceae bacterium]|nr:hypothetical protein [Polyangiaceae bacterium]